MNTVADSKNATLVVVVGIDFSPASSEILANAAEIAGEESGELHVVHVVAHPPSASTATLSRDREVESLGRADDPRAALERLLDTVEDAVRNIALHVRVGRADVEIVQLANDVDADVVVVGTHGRTGIERLLLGSVAESVVRHSPCPVVIYRQKAPAAWDQIAPPCPDCIAVRFTTRRASLWCERHSEYHARADTYSAFRSSYGMGSMTFR